MHEFEYEHIPHFPLSTVECHQGRLLAGRLNGLPVLVMQGRFHYYEGYSMQQITFPVRVLKRLGIEFLFVSNACGCVNPQYRKGELMVIEDHVNLLGDNPLIGPNLDDFGPRFPDMSAAYDRELIAIAEEEACACAFHCRRACTPLLPDPIWKHAPSTAFCASSDPMLWE